jgi:S1-C subfamily serine protease
VKKAYDEGMARAVVLATLVLACQAALSSQTLVVLHIRAVVTDAAGRSTPLARHALLISDNPPTREPRRVVTTLDGSADVRLRPGNYTVESDEPVAFEGKAYRWLQTVDVAAGRESTLELTLANALAEAIEPGATAKGADAPPATDTSLLLRQWLDSVVELWTPTAHASGFLIDASGLILTNQKVVGDAASVEVQLSRSVKVAGNVLEADKQHDVAVIRIDPTLMASIKPVPLGCPRSSPPAITRGQEIFTLAAPLRQEKGWTPGTASSANTRAIVADLHLATGGSGGPVFNEAVDIVGITTLPDEREEPRRGEARVVRIDQACETVAAATKKAADAPAPAATQLPIEPTGAAPVAAFKEAVKRRAGSLSPYKMAAADFDVSFITPILNYAAQTQSNQNFSNWSDYAADIRPLLFIRATPKRVENLLAKVARGAAYTQGMAVPAITHVGAGFLRMRALCGTTEVAPIHPFKLDLRVSQTQSIYEGFYVFDPAALGPACGTVTLVLYSEKEPEKADTHVVDPQTLQQIWKDLEVK